MLTEGPHDWVARDCANDGHDWLIKADVAGKRFLKLAFAVFKRQGQSYVSV